jgi:hypothetical protein
MHLRFDLRIRKARGFPGYKVDQVYESQIWVASRLGSHLKYDSNSHYRVESESMSQGLPTWRLPSHTGVLGPIEQDV